MAEASMSVMLKVSGAHTAQCCQEGLCHMHQTVPTYLFHNPSPHDGFSCCFTLGVAVARTRRASRAQPWWRCCRCSSGGHRQVAWQWWPSVARTASWCPSVRSVVLLISGPVSGGMQQV